LFPNGRRGWHKRPTRDYCLRVFEKYKDVDFESFTGLVKSFFGYDENASSEIEEVEERKKSESSFAKRLITGLAAEKYFISVHPTLSEFGDCTLEDTTRLGCGYDFRLHTKAHEQFLAVEVKGLRGRAGSLSLTPKEHATATTLRVRFFLFVVKNFHELPYHEIYQDPLSSGLQFTRRESAIVHVSWLATV
jgi:hypothetical protein